MYKTVLIAGNTWNEDGYPLYLETSLTTDDLAEALIECECQTIIFGEGKADRWDVISDDPIDMEADEFGHTPLEAQMTNTLIEAESVADRLMSVHGWTEHEVREHYGY